MDARRLGWAVSGTALVRPPGPRLAEGLVTHVERVPVDVELARDQWIAYRAALSDAGWDVVEVRPADDHPDAVFVEDTVVVFGPIAVLARPGADERRTEVDGVAAVLREMMTVAGPIEGPDTLDGGDVLKVAETVYVGISGRTTAGAVDQLAALLPDRRVVGVPVTKVLHLKSAVTALPDGTVVGHLPLVDDPTAFDRFLAVPEESGAAVVDLGGGRLMTAADCPESVALYRDRGYEVRTVDISEFQKLEGCVTCLSVRIRRSDP